LKVNGAVLTARQAEVYGFIRDFVRDHGYGPTVREIGDAVGITTTNGVVGHLKLLLKKGVITQTANTCRSLRTIDNVPATLRNTPESLEGDDARLYQFVAKFTATNGLPPSLREIKNALQFSNFHVPIAIILRLNKLGHLKYTPGVARSLQVTEP
jgi:SOS-response transcriptional repressor LexA